jgi:phosphatidylglycerophosphatase A
MVIINYFKKFCYDVATFGGLGEWFIGGFIASFFAVPLVLIGRALSYLMPSIFHWFILGFIVFAIIVIQVAYSSLEEKKDSVIVLDKMVGMIIALYGITIRMANWKVILVGYGCFFVLTLLKPLLLRSKFLHRIDHMSGVVGVLASDVIFGVITNLLLRLILFLIK